MKWIRKLNHPLNASKIPAATLFVQGSSFLANSQFDSMVRALEKANNPPDKVVHVKGRPTDSGFKNIKIDTEVQIEIAAFIKKYIPPNANQ